MLVQGYADDAGGGLGGVGGGGDSSVEDAVLNYLFKVVV